MNLQDIYDLIEANLENGIDHTPNKMGKLKRIKLPIPSEYGGGYVTGFGYEETVRNLIHKLKDQIVNNYQGPLFSECWDSWIEIKANQNKSACTIANYKRNAKNHLLPFFSKKKIDQISADDIQQYYNSIMHLSKSVSNQSQAILKGIFERADRLGLIRKNPMMYKYDISKKIGEKVVLQDDQLVNVISKLDILSGKEYLYACFLCFTALRRGEILGLKWSDIDFENAQIHIRTNITFPDGTNNPIITFPKDESYGIVHLQKSLAERIIPFKRSGYIISYNEKETDKPITKSIFTKMWNRIKKNIDLQGATSHSFRSTYATMMNAHCKHIDPKVLQKALRHKTPDLAIKVYTKENKNKMTLVEKEYDEYLCSTLEHNS